MKLKIITDSSSDYTVEEAKQLNIELIPLTLTFDGQDFSDGITITKEDFYKRLVEEKKFPKTSQPSPEVFIHLFEQAQKREETVLVLLIAKALSGSYQNALLAKEIVGYESVYIMDTGTTIAGLQILTEEALKLFKQGKTIEEIIEALKHLQQRIVILACMNTLEYLVKGGRLSATAGFMGNVLNLKPILTIRPDGTLAILSKPIGKNHANLILLKSLKNNPPSETYPIYYYYSYQAKNLDVLVDKMKKENLYREGKRVNLSPVVGCHIGDQCYGIVYVQKEESSC